MMKLSVLGPEGVGRVDEAARRILSRTGVIVPHEKMLDMFDEAGAVVDRAQQRVRISSDLLDRCLGQAAKSFTIYGRDRSKTAAFGQGKRNYNAAAGEASWLQKDGTRRYTCLEDVVTASKLCEVLDQITIAGAMSDPAELDVSYRCVEVAATQLKTTTKPITFWPYDRASARFLIELFTAMAGGNARGFRLRVGFPAPSTFAKHP